MMKKTASVKTRRAKMTPLSVVMLVVLILYAALLLYMLYWAIITSLKEPLSFIYNRVGWPDEWCFTNFSYVLNNAKTEKIINGVRTEIPFATMALNSVLYSVGGAFFQTLVPFVTAYLCARYKYKFSKIVYGVVLIVMVIPVVGSQTSEIEMAMRLGIYDHIWGLWIMKANFLGMYFLVFYETFKSLPDAYSEAATIDGAGEWAIMLRIAMPLAKTVFFTVLLINFVTLWNDFQTPMLYLPTKPTLSEHLFWIRGSSAGLFSKKPVQMAAAVIFVVPIVILFLLFHKRLLGNLTIGGIKG